MDVLDLIREADVIPAPPSDFVPFGAWSPADRQMLRQHGELVRLSPGEVVIRQGAEDRSLLIALEGELDVVRGGRTVHRVLPGDLVGELAFVDGRPRSANVRACGAAVVFRLRPEDVTRLSQANAALALKLAWEIARILAVRLRDEWG